MTSWETILTTKQLANHWADCAKLDPAFAARAQAWWHNQDCNALRVETSRAWYANARETYCLARSYLAMRAPHLFE
jgi:hypothetical protein